MTGVSGRIVASGLTKTFGPVTAVDDVSFTVEPGTVTGFLGPNGAGKTTTLRMLLGLVTPDSGAATISGRPYPDLTEPAGLVGATLEATGFHPARTGRDHLRVYCTVNGYPSSRADDVLTAVGLTDAARRKVGSYSLGMRQRLALAAAMLGDPAVLVLDEPANGLDPEGIAWMRHHLRAMADQGKTVLVSSHVLSEAQQLVDHVVILRRGRVVHQGALTDLGVEGEAARTMVKSPHADRLAALLADRVGEEARVERHDPETLTIIGPSAAEIGRIAFRERIELHQLTTRSSDLEQAFFALTADQNPEHSA